MRSRQHAGGTDQHGEGHGDDTQRQVDIEKRHRDDKRAGGVAAGHTFADGGFAEHGVHAVFLIRPLFPDHEAQQCHRCQHRERQDNEIRPCSRYAHDEEFRHDQGGVGKEQNIRQHPVDDPQKAVCSFIFREEPDGCLIAFSVHRSRSSQFVCSYFTTACAISQVLSSIIDKYRYGICRTSDPAR